MVAAEDRRAVETIPLRLMIVAVVAGLSVAPAADALEALKDRSFLDRCAVQLEAIVATAQVISLEGIGSKRTMNLDLHSDGGLRMDVLLIGGCWMEPFMSSVALELSSGRSITRHAQEPFVWLASASHGQLVEQSAVFSLSLTASEVGGERLVICEVMPWTS